MKALHTKHIDFSLYYLPFAELLVRHGSKGHFGEALHQELAQRVEGLLPVGTKVIFLGDGEFDGAELLEGTRPASRASNYATQFINLTTSSTHK